MHQRPLSVLSFFPFLKLLHDLKKLSASPLSSLPLLVAFPEYLLGVDPQGRLRPITVSFIIAEQNIVEH